MPPLVAEALDSLMPSPQQWTILFLLLAGLVAAYLRLRKRRPKDWEATSHRRAAADDLRPAEQTRRDLEHLVGELRALTSRLDRSIEEADQRIQVLRSLLDEAARPAEAPVGGPVVQQPVMPDLSVSPEPPAAAGEGVAAPPMSPQTAADHRRQRIYELADRGLSPVQIAAQVGQSTGEVELILNLRRTLSSGFESRP